MKPLFALALALVAGGMAAAIPYFEDVTRFERIPQGPEAPSGYYLDPETGVWWRKTSTGLVEQPPTFTPPASASNGLDLHVAGDAMTAGWELRTHFFLIGSHSVTYLVDYAFADPIGPFCERSETSRSLPPCHSARTLAGGNCIGTAGATTVVLSCIDSLETVTKTRPVSGRAEAWAWQDDGPFDKDGADWRAAGIAW